MISWILELDKILFLKLNSFHSPFWDQFFLIYTNSKSWIPVILLMVVLLFYKFSWQQALIFVLLISAAVGMGDFVASGILKPYFARPRPCHQFPEIMTLVGGCGGLYSFASSHAANSIGLFTAFSLVFKDNKYVYWGLLSWAVLMCYSRIYVGVHFPSDLLVGAAIGIIVPQMFFYIYNKVIQQRK